MKCLVPTCSYSAGNRTRYGLCAKHQQLRWVRRKRGLPYTPEDLGKNLSWFNHVRVSRNMCLLKEYKAKLGGKCQRCGINNPLCIHHKNRNFLDNTNTNLELLCYSCHKVEHSPYKNLALSKKERYDLYLKRYYDKIAKKACKRNIPNGFITSSQICQKFNISREYLRQIRNQKRINFTILESNGHQIFVYPKEALIIIKTIPHKLINYIQGEKSAKRVV